MRAGRPSICRKPATTTLPSETTSAPAETEKAGRRVGGRRRRGDVELLTGALGAGKTTFVRGVAHGTGSESPVASPTFQLVRVYPGRLQLAHIDLYRVESNSELRDLGLEGWAGQGPVVAGWGDGMRGDGSGRIQMEHFGGAA